MAYPSDSYYDPNRPSFLPFWIDTPTESAMKIGMYPGADTKTVYEAPTPAKLRAPQTLEQFTKKSSWTPVDAASQDWQIPDLPESVREALELAPKGPGTGDGFIVAAMVVSVAAVWSLRK